MKTLNITKKILILTISLVSVAFSVVSAETYEKNGLVFVVGEHRPQERVNPKIEKSRTIIINNSNENILFGEENINENNLENILPQVNTETHPLELNSGAHATIGGVWTNASSRALKENILGIDNNISLDTVLNLQPVTYNYKVQPGETYVGFIAEDVPDLVATNARTALSPMDIVAVVVGAIKEIWDKIISIQENIFNIFNRLSVIEDKLGIINENEEGDDVIIEEDSTEEKDEEIEEVVGEETDNNQSNNSGIETGEGQGTDGTTDNQGTENETGEESNSNDGENNSGTENDGNADATSTGDEATTSGDSEDDTGNTETGVDEVDNSENEENTNNNQEEDGNVIDNNQNNSDTDQTDSTDNTSEENTNNNNSNTESSSGTGNTDDGSTN